MLIFESKVKSLFLIESKIKIKIYHSVARSSEINWGLALKFGAAGPQFNISRATRGGARRRRGARRHVHLAQIFQHSHISYADMLIRIQCIVVGTETYTTIQAYF